jgi:uncharacterized protein
MSAIASPAIRQVLTEIEQGLRQTFGERLRFVRLFGSWARGEANEFSDIDVAVVIEGLTWEERTKITDVTVDIELQHMLFVSLFICPGERFDEMLQREYAIAEDIMREGLSP